MYHQPVMPRQHLAWHETLELHELTASQATVLMKCKASVHKVPDRTLQTIYLETIQMLEKNLQELLPFFSHAPRGEHASHDLDAAFWASDLLAAAKSAMRNYAIAITETATPQLREVLSKQLHGAIELHAMIFYYMCENDDYPAYDLEKLLKNDVKNAHKALRMSY
ncbi:spore coat protein [Shouchella shacheensis]|uniref:spore coat protein n=1 Tax=Shouchella shacheensis TaxID=1649580 RepID=UPI000ADDA074|nr:spore coat protein [Shouchella shacheensis]